MNEQAKHALFKSGRENFVAGYVDLGVLGGVPEDKRDELTELANNTFDAIAKLVVVTSEINQTK